MGIGLSMKEPEVSRIKEIYILRAAAKVYRAEVTELKTT